MVLEIISGVIFRPPRSQYSNSDVPSKVISGNAYASRKEIEITNSKNQIIRGSRYIPQVVLPDHPCILYLHGNASSQVEGIFTTCIFSEFGILTCMIDAIGCGRSDGDNISLGLREKDGIPAVCQYLRNVFKVQKIILYGRSMGAATALWSACEQQNIDAIVCDSPYISISEIAADLVHHSLILRFLSKFIYPIISISVVWNAGYSMNEVDMSKILSNGRIPAFFIHGIDDNLINIRQTRAIYSLSGEEVKYFLSTSF
jgi:pimeloyl-ACP methyl ester carboxylesterase